MGAITVPKFKYSYHNKKRFFINMSNIYETETPNPPLSLRHILSVG